MDYEEMEKKTREMEAENKKLLEEFRAYLTDSGLSKRTVNSHVGNMDLFLNGYLPREEIYSAQEGVNHVGMFFSWFLPQKVLDSSPTLMKNCGASLKKFYKMMADQGKVSKEDYKEMADRIKEEMEVWLEALDGGEDFGGFGFW